jgi:hypothetical protein
MMRDEFERWASDNWATSTSWLAWQAAYAAGLRRAAEVCREWGNARVARWTELGDEEMTENAKARAWDGLQCAAAIEQEIGK